MVTGSLAIGNSRIYNADCMRLLGGGLLHDETVDAVITDPPYGISFRSGQQRGTGRARFRAIANDKAPYIWWLPYASAALKDGGCLACFSRWDVQDTFVRAIELAGLTVRSIAVWDKCSHGMGNLKQAFAPSHETVIFATKGAFSFPGKRPSDVIRVPKVPSGKLVHPNEKPVDLMRAIVDSVCPSGGVVLDPFMGSGPVGVACAESGRGYIGIEMDEAYYEIAAGRIESACMK